MVSFLLLDTGEETTADDPARGIWYSANNHCGYWTDDWNKIGESGGIPICPKCGCPGMQITANKWFDSAEKFQINKPHYVAFLESRKESCLQEDGFTANWMNSYAAFVEQRE